MATSSGICLLRKQQTRGAIEMEGKHLPEVIRRLFVSNLLE